ncbi:ABC transporter substrate-binding protein [Dysosmobacter sp. HCP28S3_G4]|uniref:ABC transporter substrate-binding protein n=1 Tax=Dysosmobacter sp. HCP28S3_G4 TaxID=3438938 RepID=UPI003F0F98C8
MKKILTMALALSMALTMAACGSSNSGAASTPAAGSSAASASAAGSSAAAEPEDAFTTVESGKLHMATNAAFPPYEMTDDNGGFEGIDVEIATAIADKLGLELVVDDMDFSSVINAVQGGKADIAMAGLTVNEERKQNVDFTASYATGVQVVIVPEDSDITTVDDLSNDKMIGTQEATTGYIYCSDTPENGGYGEDHVVAYTNGATAIQALLGGKVDAVVIDNEPAKAFVAANPTLKILDTEYVTEEYAIGISKENNALLDAVNGALEELIADGTVQSIVDKYITAD